MPDWQQALTALSSARIREEVAELSAQAPEAPSVQVHAVIARLMTACGILDARERSLAHEPLRQAVEDAVIEQPGLTYVHSGY